MSADQAAKLAHQLILLTIVFLHPVVNQKLTFALEGAVSEVIRGWLTGPN